MKRCTAAENSEGPRESDNSLGPSPGTTTPYFYQAAVAVTAERTGITRTAPSTTLRPAVSPG